MAKYTYDDFLNAANAAGLIGTFSDDDIRLAQRNPDAGMELVRYKNDYNAATTDEARTLAHMGAEGIRANGAVTPSSFSYAEQPAYQNNYANEIQDLYDRQKNYGSYSYNVAQPTYNNRYDGQIQDMLGQIVNRQDFAYDAATDPLYAQYRKQYVREGQRATQDTLGAAAAATGGLPSSYATTAAAQAGNYYAAQMTDKIPELYQLAYNKYVNDHSMKLADLGALQGAEQSDYDKFLNELNQYNTNRNFDYGVWSDEYNRIANDLATAQGLEQQDYAKYLDVLNQYNTDRSFDYGRVLDQANLDMAGDQAELEKALQAAQYGDFSYLNTLGINPNGANLAAFNASAKGVTGGGGGYRASGGGDEPTPDDDDEPIRDDDQKTTNSLYSQLNSKDKATFNTYRAQLGRLRGEQAKVWIQKRYTESKINDAVARALLQMTGTSL